MANEMRIKIKKQFLSPLTIRMVKSGQEMNVPCNQFWLKRLHVGDCEKIKSKGKAKAALKEKDLPAPKEKDSPAPKEKDSPAPKEKDSSTSKSYKGSK